MRIALVHDYLKEFGGAERVLKVLSEMYPDAPIYTAFRVRGSAADKEFEGKDIRESFLAPLIKIGKLYSPLRFLTPLIWRSMDLSSYDVVITSASWYITRGFRVSPRTKVICYCHTPPRWLYGFETSIELQKYWPVKMYALVVGHFMRMYDAWSVETVDTWIANSENVKKRISKFYRKDSRVIYPPIEVSKIEGQVADNKKKGNYFLIVSRLVGAKGLEETALAFRDMKGFKLKIIGERAGYSQIADRLEKMSHGNIELLGRVLEKDLYKIYTKATGFIALAREEDFGMTVVEAMAAGTPVIAFDGGGFRESVVDGKTGILINDTDKETIAVAVKEISEKKWSKKALQSQAKKFSKEVFVSKMKRVVKETYKE